jgi:UDP-glucose 4-epimerase
VNELFAILKELTKSDCKEVHGPAKKGEQLRSTIDATKLGQQLGWEAKVGLYEGLRKTVDYFSGRLR